MNTKVCIHGAQSTRVVTPRSPHHRAQLVRETAQREGWAYATVLSGPGVRVVTESSVGAVEVGSLHAALDVYEQTA
jgi:hypothetical protein